MDVELFFSRHEAARIIAGVWTFTLVLDPLPKRTCDLRTYGGSRWERRQDQARRSTTVISTTASIAWLCASHYASVLIATNLTWAWAFWKY